MYIDNIVLGLEVPDTILTL